jgi:hypothetical protein
VSNYCICDVIVYCYVLFQSSLLCGAAYPCSARLYRGQGRSDRYLPLAGLGSPIYTVSIRENGRHSPLPQKWREIWIFSISAPDWLFFVVPLRLSPFQSHAFSWHKKIFARIGTVGPDQASIKFEEKNIFSNFRSANSIFKVTVWSYSVRMNLHFLHKMRFINKI